MRHYKWALVAILSGSLALYGSVAAAAARASEVEAVIGSYFKAFCAKNVDAMGALSAPTIKVVDYGQDLNLGDWHWYLKSIEFKRIDKMESPCDIKLSDFSTRVHEDFAYTSFLMDGDFASAVLKRIDGKWRIDYLSIEKEQKWLPWLRDRIAKGQDVSDWYEDYLKEHP